MLEEAKAFVRDLINVLSPAGIGFYLGNVDVNAGIINFQAIADAHDLSDYEYEELIDYAQSLAEERIVKLIK